MRKGTVGKLLVGFVLLNALLFSADMRFGPLPVGFYRVGNTVLAYVSDEPPPPNATWISLEEFESWFNPNASIHWRQPKNPIKLNEPSLSFCPLDTVWLTPQNQPELPELEEKINLDEFPSFRDVSAYTPRRAATDAWGTGNVKGLYRDQLRAEGYRSLDEVTSAMRDPAKGHDLCMKYKLGVWLGRSGLALPQESQNTRVQWLFKPYSDFWNPTVTGYSLTGFSYLTYDDLIESMRSEGFEDNYIKEAFMRGPLRACGYAWVPWSDKDRYGKCWTNIPDYLFPDKHAYEQAWLNRFYCWPIQDNTWILRNEHIDICVGSGIPSDAYFRDNQLQIGSMRGNRRIPLIVHYSIFEKLTQEDQQAAGNTYLLFTPEGPIDLKPTHSGTLKYSEFYTRLQSQYPDLTKERLTYAAEVYTTQFYVKDIQAKMERIDATWAKRYPFKLRPLPWHKKLEELGLDLDDIHPSPCMTLFKRFLSGDMLTLKAAANLPMSEDEIKQYKTSVRNDFAQELGQYLKRHTDFFCEWDVEYYCSFIEKTGLKQLADEIRRQTPAPNPKLWSMTPISLSIFQQDQTATIGKLNATLTTLRQLGSKNLPSILDIETYLEITSTEAKKIGEKWLKTCKAPDLALAMLGTDHRQLDGFGIGVTPLSDNTAVDNAMILAGAIGFMLLAFERRKINPRSRR